MANKSISRYSKLEAVIEEKKIDKKINEIIENEEKQFVLDNLS